MRSATRADPGGGSAAQERDAPRCRQGSWHSPGWEVTFEHHSERAQVSHHRLDGACELVAPATAVLGVALMPGTQGKLPALCAREGAAGTGHELRGSEDGAQQARLPCTLCTDCRAAYRRATTTAGRDVHGTGQRTPELLSLGIGQGLFGTP